MVFMKTSYDTQNCHQCCFLEYNEGWLELVFEGNFFELYLPCMYKMLVACASINKGRSLLIS